MRFLLRVHLRHAWPRSIAHDARPEFALSDKCASAATSTLLASYCGLLQQITYAFCSTADFTNVFSYLAWHASSRSHTAFEPQQHISFFLFNTKYRQGSKMGLFRRRVTEKVRLPGVASSCSPDSTLSHVIKCQCYRLLCQVNNRALVYRLARQRTRARTLRRRAKRASRTRTMSFSALRTACANMTRRPRRI